MSRYRKKPVVIEAIEWTGKNPADIFLFTHHLAWREPDGTMMLPTLEGDMIASVGDFIIKGIQGEFYPCKPLIFHETYEAVGDDDAPV